MQLHVTRLPQPRRMWLATHYAPQAGRYTVVTVVAGWRMGYLTVVGHVVRRRGGRLQRLWLR